MDYRQQLVDAGAVIGYRPDIRIYKKDPIDGSVPQEDGIVFVPSPSSYSSYSKVVQRYAASSPSTVLEGISEVLDLCNEVMDSLSEEFNRKGFPGYSSIDKYISALRQKDPYADTFLKALDTVEGSIIPSVIKVLTEQEELLKQVRDTFATLTYGSNISDSAAEERDSAVLKRIFTNDLAGSGNNLALLYMDTKFNRCIQIYSENMEESFLSYSDIPSYKYDDVPESIDKNFCKYLESRYDALTEKHDKLYSVYNHSHLQQQTAKKSMYLYHDTCNNMNDYYMSLMEMQYPGEYLISIGNEYQGHMDKAMDDVVKSFLANGSYLKRTESILLEKQNLINIRGSLLQ